MSKVVDAAREATRDNIPGILAIMVTFMVALAALTPYVVLIPKDNLNLITQAQTTLWNGWLVILGYYFATTSNQRKKDDIISTQADTIQKAQAALPSVPGAVQGDTIPVSPGEVKTVVGTDTPTQE